ncbi:MAG: 6-bladed beta-propeller [Prolixibacteraceae bacterium]|jgi:hypothetical protein|nr:6-bladed beta-propeller [Prolixibacteraceae bacterium]
MNLRNPIKYILFFLALLYGCKHEQKQGYLNFNKVENKYIEITDLCDSICYIPLDNHIPLNNIQYIRKSLQFYFIWANSKGLLKFSKSGEFLTQIGAIGRGPKEYNKYSVFDINREAKEIYILSEKKILVYNFMGEFIKELNIKLDYFVQNIDFLAPYYLVLSTFNSYGDAPFNWIIVDLNGKEVSEKVNGIHFKTKGFFGLVPSFITYKYDNCVYYFEQLNDTIFQIVAPGNTNNPYIFDKADKRFHPDIYKNGISNLSNHIIPKNISESSKYLIIQASELGDNNLFMYDKKRNKFFRVKNEVPGVINNFDNGPCFIPSIITEYNNAIQIINAFEFKAHIASKAFKISTPQYSDKKKALEQLANSLDENDNPVLMLVKLKE